MTDQTHFADDVTLARIAALEAENAGYKDALVAVDMARKEGLRKLAAAKEENARLVGVLNDTRAEMAEVLLGMVEGDATCQECGGNGAGGAHEDDCEKGEVK